MIKKLMLILFAISLQNICLATIFLPLPFEKQVEEATSGVEVQLNSSRVFKNALGTIMTEYSFDVLEAYNLSDEDLENQKLKLTMPGGSFEGITSVIDGAPQFNQEERSFLLLKKIESKIYLSNFSLGKFKIEEQDGKVFYVSEVFPTDPKIGRIAKNKMIELMKTKWKTSLSEPSIIIEPEVDANYAKPLTAFFKNNDKRQPAQEAAVAAEIPAFFWSAMLIFAFFFTFIFFKLGKSEHQHKRE